MRTVTCFLLVIAMFADVSQQYTTYRFNQQQRTTTITPQQPKNCRKDWVKLGGSCYRFGRVPLSWPDASWICRANGGSLAEINSLEEHNRVVAYIRTIPELNNRVVSYWIGAAEMFKEGHWSWLSNKGFTGLYTNWAQGQPDNYGGVEHCLELRNEYNFLWNDLECIFQNAFVCESRPLNEG